MKKYITKIFVLLPLVIIFTGFNYAIDPENLFTGGTYEKGIADYMASGKNVTDVFNFDERILQEDYINNLIKSPDIVVLGSSREFELNAGLLNEKGKTVINNCVSGCTLEDELAIFEIYNKKGILPKKIIMGIEPYFLERGKNGRALYESIGDYYNEICDTLGIQKPKPAGLLFKYRNVKKLFLIQYFQESVVFATNTGNNHRYVATDSKYNSSMTRLSDGSLTYSKEQRERGTIEVENIINSVNPDELANYFHPMAAYDQDMVNKLDKFIDFVTKKGIEIELVMPPYYPLWYKRLKADPKFNLFLSTEDFYKNLARDKKIIFVGSLDPDVYKIGADGFYDEMHVRPSGMAKVFQKTQ